MTHTQLPRRRGSKALGGCLIVVAILLLGVAAAGWWFIGRPLVQFTSSLGQIDDIQAMSLQLNDRTSYAPPADGALQPQQLDRYLLVLGDIREEMQAHLQVLEQRYEQFGTEQPGLLDIPRLAGAYADFIGLIGQARQAQINALNRHGFSESEYGWTRREVLRAAGMQGATYDLNAYLTALGGSGDLQSQLDRQAPPQGNVELVRERQAELGELGFLALLGL